MTVKEDSGAALPDATVDITGPTPGEAKTGADGVAKFGGLVDGTYTVTGSKSGYTTVKASPDTNVPAGGTAKVEIRLTKITVEIQINNTPGANDDIVQVQCSFPAHRHKVSCRIKLAVAVPADVTVVLVNADGRLRFPDSGDTTKTLTLAAAGAWTAFEISGESASAAIGDATIDARHTSATGAVLGSKPATVFSFDQAQITLTKGGNYTISGGSYTIPGGKAASFSATARIRPAGIDCSAPQVSVLQIGIMQESSNFAAMTTWNAPTVKWLPGVATGTAITVPTTMRTTDTYAATVALPVADTDANCTPLYDRPGQPTTLDANSTKPPTGCPAAAPATSFDTPSGGVTATLVQTISAGGSPAAKVTWRNPVAGRTEHFRTFCVVFNTSNSQFCALREATWDLDLDSSRAAAQHATVNTDGAATAAPATGVAANNAATATTTAGVGAATTSFTQQPKTAAVSGGNGQSASVNTAFGSALQVITKDVDGNPVSGVTVTFTAPAGGAGGSFSGGNTAVTDATGVATAPAFTANATAGHYSVTAAAAGVAATVHFSLTNTP